MEETTPIKLKRQATETPSAPKKVRRGGLSIKYILGENEMREDAKKGFKEYLKCQFDPTDVVGHRRFYKFFDEVMRLKTEIYISPALMELMTGERYENVTLIPPVAVFAYPLIEKLFFQGFKDWETAKQNFTSFTYPVREKYAEGEVKDTEFYISIEKCGKEITLCHLADR